MELRFKKSTSSNPSGDSVEVAVVPAGLRAGDHTATYCCGVAPSEIAIAVRDSKDNDRPMQTILYFNTVDWLATLDLIGTGRLDAHVLLAAQPGTTVVVVSGIGVTPQHDGTVGLSCRGCGLLRFTAAEWSAFVAGAKERQFDVEVLLREASIAG